MNEAGYPLMSVLPTIPKARVFPTEQTEPCDLKLKGLVASLSIVLEYFSSMSAHLQGDLCCCWVRSIGFCIHNC